jgi:asparagine synthase (glutamine-hydrolysing)
MCGITGFTWEDAKLVKAMTEALAHRGPNDQGIFVTPDVSLGHRRLSILDLSSAGHQPMFNEDGKIVTVFNGEIWNYQTLKSKLMKHKFKSNSDTEVILHGYEEWGSRIFSMLEGMFAIALWDTRTKTLFLARDARGKKPLYYAQAPRGIIFASELKSLLCFPGISKKINPLSLGNYLQLRFVPGNNTIFSTIHRIPPGTFVKINQNKISKHMFAAPLTYSPGKNSSTEKVDSLIRLAVEKRLISDVPIGVFLSGGLDSSALVAYMSSLGKKVKTFSVGFGDKTDETKYARIVAKHFKTEHHEIKLTKNILNYLPEVIWYADEPLADPACLPTYLLCKEVSKHVKVVLSGEGGDEVFGGYQSYNLIPHIKLLFSLPENIRIFILAPLLFKLSSLTRYPLQKKFFVLGKVCQSKNVEIAFKELFYFPFGDLETKEIMRRKTIGVPFLKVKSGNLEASALKHYFEELLPNDLLMKADKMGMANGLEIRTPFLDKDLIDYFLSTPFSARRNRKLFKETIKQKLPIQILRKPKQGFVLPLYAWFVNPSILKKITPFLLNLKKRQFFEEKIIDKLISSPTLGKNDHKIWALLNFEIWCLIFIDGKDYSEIKL